MNIEDLVFDLLKIGEGLENVLDDLATKEAQEFVYNILDKIHNKIDSLNY